MKPRTTKKTRPRATLRELRLLRTKLENTIYARDTNHDALKRLQAEFECKSVELTEAQESVRDLGMLVTNLRTDVQRAQNEFNQQSKLMAGVCARNCEMLLGAENNERTMALVTQFLKDLAADRWIRIFRRGLHKRIVITATTEWAITSHAATP